jgi:hypothetical protein
MATMLEKSQRVMRSNASIFDVPATDVSVLSSNYIQISPTYDLNHSFSIHFSIPPSGLQYMDLASSFLYLKLKLLNKDGSSLISSDIVAPTTMFFHSVFKNCIVQVNGSTVSDSNNMHSYIGGIPTLLMNGKGEKASELTSMLFYKDTVPDLFDPIKNEGFKVRQELASASKTFDMLGPIPVPLCQQSRYLPTYCAVTIDFTRQDPAFCLDAPAITSEKDGVSVTEEPKSYKYEFEVAQLYVKMHTIMPDLVEIHNKAFLKKRAQYPIRSTFVRASDVPMGSQIYMSQTMHNGILPSAVVLGMVSSKARAGDFKKDPYNFQNFGLKSVTLTSDNDPTLTRRIEVDFKNNNYLLGYQTLFKALGNRTDGNDISRDEYKQGNALYLFDLQKTSATEFHTQQTGQLKV